MRVASKMSSVSIVWAICQSHLSLANSAFNSNART